MEVEQKEMQDVLMKLKAFLLAMKNPDEKVTSAILHLDEVCIQIFFMHE